MPHLVKMPELRVVAVSDVDTNRRAAGKKRVDDAYGNTDCAAYSDYRELLARDDIHAIVCATPDHWHALVILDVCKAGKDMYCEKPLTNNLIEAKTVMDAVQASKIISRREVNSVPVTTSGTPANWYGTVASARSRDVEVGVGGPPKPCNLPAEELEAGLDWQRWLGAATHARVQLSAQPRGVHNHFPSWRKFLRVWRWRHD